MHVITLETVSNQMVTVVAENICSMMEQVDQEGTVIELANSTQLVVRESMLEITQKMQTAARI
jgi:uncharacterized protein YlzI (FlbEa/FlbD family)